MATDDETRKTLDEMSYYELLDVPPDATRDAIKRAFHEFALDFHPDGSAGEERVKLSTIYRRGAEAYRVLMDAESRARYDVSLKEGVVRLSEDTKAPVKRILSTAARPFVMKAKQAMQSGNTSVAKLNLQIALRHDEGHPEILKLLSLIDSDAH